MDITIEMIAEKAHVSRGTVDRVIHNRGKVNPETAERIRKIMKDLNFQPNTLGRAFALAKQKIKIGVLVSFKEQDFFDQVMTGVADGKAYAEQFGFEILVESTDYSDLNGWANILDRFEAEKVSAIALRGFSNPVIKERIKTIRDGGVRVITFNDDMDVDCRDCFVGQNHKQSGLCAAQLMCDICHGTGKVLVVGVDPEHKASVERIASFGDYLKSTGRLVATPPQYCHGNNSVSYELVKANLEISADYQGIYVSAAGLSGACKAVCEAGLSGKVKVIGFDTIRSNLQYLKQGTVQFLIDQNPYQQGYMPLRMLTENLFHGQNFKQNYYSTGIEIKNRYNVE